MNMNRQLARKWVGLISVLTLCSASGAMAAKKVNNAGPAPETDPEVSEEVYNKELKAAEARGSRSVATADALTEQALSDSFNNLRSRIIGGPVYKSGKETSEIRTAISTPEELQTLLVQLNDDAYYNTLDSDAKFVAAQMAPLLAFNGFFNRVMNLIPKAPVAHLGVVTALRTFGSGVMTYFPTDQWKAGLLYVTKPMDSTHAPIDNELEFHQFIQKELEPAIRTMKHRLKELSFAAKPVYIDNKIFYGTANFVSDKDRFVRVGEAERHAALGGAYFILSSLDSLSAYNLSGLFEAMDEVGAAYGFTALNSQVTGNLDPAVATPKKRFDILRKYNGKTGLFDRRAGGEEWMNAAYLNLNNAVVEAAYSWAELRKHNQDANLSGNLLDPRAFVPFSRVINTSLSNLHYIISANGQSNLQSAVSASDGKTVTLRNFFLKSPSSLVELFPLDYDKTPYKNTVTIKGHTREWHNFLNGRPVHWNVDAYSKLFPQVTSDADVVDAARVSAQAWGGWMIGLPMSAFTL